MRKDELLLAVSKVSKTAKAKNSVKTVNGHTAGTKKTKATASRTTTQSKLSAPPKKKTGKAPSSRAKPAAAASKVGAPSKAASSKGISKVAKSSEKLSVAQPRGASKRPSKAAAPVAKAPIKKVAAKSKPVATTDPKVLKRIRELQLQRQSNKDISFRPTLVRPPATAEPIWEKEPLNDRIALFVRDAHWMHASWDITRNAIERAKAAMLEHWHGAKPVLRLLRMEDTGTSSTAETVERDIEIHGGSRNWYIEWTGEAAKFRVLIGYLSLNGRFHVMAKSNIVKTPAAGSTDAVDEHWSDLGAESERIFAISGGYDTELETGELQEILEDRLHRTLGAPALAKLGAGADGPFRRRGGFHFDMDVELIVYGSTVPDGYLTLNGEPVMLRTDGTFALRVPFPDRRQVLPAVACSRDGSQQRTIVVAVERNTKIMEPLESEQDTGE